ncbi:formate/nitrite transporter family protein [Natronomonas halophila]|uniref:formate/nitrite transporter family protein n=1 Tax=Natronomonas halophila TaxID=2747817 RepID=UPI0015B6E059|nr:formate/nitrite transporter family protein [Natronomonas halophila]QLD84875.1 formate/nitrite transporter family protein [Natronomonas halophila]
MSSDDDPSGATLSYRNILEREMENALQEVGRPGKGLFLSGVSAGLNLSFGVLFMAMALTYAGGFGSDLTKQAVLAFVSAIAFLFVVIGQTELFTAQATMAVLPVLDGRIGLAKLGRLWSIIYAGNMLGCAGFALLIATVGPPMGIVTPSAAGALADALTGLSWWVVLLSAVIAGWLMGLATWLAAASRDTIGRVTVVLLITATIGFGPFHHVILGTTELLTAMLLGQGVGLPVFGGFLLVATVGNVIGGSVFVGLLNYGHIALAGDDADVDVGSDDEDAE